MSKQTDNAPLIVAGPGGDYRDEISADDLTGAPAYADALMRCAVAGLAIAGAVLLAGGIIAAAILS